MNAAELFVECLVAEGVTRIFGVPGEENAAFVLALEDSPIEFVLTRQEQGAAFMAEIHGRLTGEPGVCLATLGPGATNLVTGVADANMDRAPLIAITGQADSHRQHKESHQYMDVVAMFEPVTKWATPIRNPEDIPEVVHKAFKLATAEKPGACHIELSEDIASREVVGSPFKGRRPRQPVPSDEVIALAWECITSAKRPVILAGNGCVRGHASVELRRLAEATGIGVLNTFMAKGVVGRHSPSSLFTIGLQAKDYPALAIDEADLVIAIGYDIVEYPPKLWNPNGDKRIVHFDSLPAEVDESYNAEVEVVGDLANALLRLNGLVEENPFHKDHDAQLALRETMLADFAEHAEDDTEGIVRPQKVMWDVREALGSSDILLSDVGAHKMWIARYYQCDEPNTCLIPNGFAAMGFALPGAISASIVHPERKILAIAGDGGFLMNVQEMETAVRLKSNLTVMVWVDGAYGLIEWKQNTQFGRHTPLSFGNPDFGKLAAAFGWEYFPVANASDVRPMLDSALSHDGPSLITIPIDYRENALLTERLGNIERPI
ncbi:MAG: acetolactate synthase large subunit [Chloroflexi bacterium]|nr:acetolactate synthase large subunit [Chloroflexota bacterium]